MSEDRQWQPEVFVSPAPDLPEKDPAWVPEFRKAERLEKRYLIPGAVLAALVITYMVASLYTEFRVNIGWVMLTAIFSIMLFGVGFERREKRVDKLAKEESEKDLVKPEQEKKDAK